MDMGILLNYALILIGKWVQKIICKTNMIAKIIISICPYWKWLVMWSYIDHKHLQCSSGTLGPIPKKFLRDNLPNTVGYWSNFQPSRSNTVGGVALKRYKMAFWTTFLALALGPLVQFQKNFLGTIYQIWRGSGPIFSLLGPILWEELH